MLRKSGAAELTNFAHTPDPRNHLKQNDKHEFTFNKVSSIDKRSISLQTSAVRVVNFDTGVSTPAYA